MAGQDAACLDGGAVEGKDAGLKDGGQQGSEVQTDPAQAHAAVHAVLHH